MTGHELDEIVRELYALPPTDFVAARNELVRQARAAGSREVAERLQHLRRPTRSAWLVNLLARDSAAMQRLSTLGRALRDAQTELAYPDFRNLAEQRRQLIADLMERVRVHAEEAGVRPSGAVLAEVETTLQAALVDLAGAMTIRNGRLVRPLSHSGFGRRPRVPPTGSTFALAPIETPDEEADGEEGASAVEDELAARRRAFTGLRVVPASGNPDDAPDPGAGTQPESLRGERRAEEELAAAEAAHWQAEFDLADAEGAVEAAADRVSSLDTQRIEARRDNVTAQRYLTEAGHRQRAAVQALAEARRLLDAIRHAADQDD